jgi:glycosyltransferase involved in cell wall biosynthesis
VCVLAHNEQTNIESTLKNIYNENPGVQFDLRVYANGCTDDTVRIAQSLGASIPRLSVRNLPVASKPLAWNIAFFENDHDIIIFSDADIMVDHGTVEEFISILLKDEGLIIVSSTIHPISIGQPLVKKMVAFMQVPVAQDFLCGGFYAVRRKTLAGIFTDLRIEGMPPDIAGEDVFLERLIGRSSLCVSTKRCHFQPPTADEYCAYLARVRWQNGQLDALFEKFKGMGGPDYTRRMRYANKLRLLAASPALCARVCSFLARSLFKLAFSRRISIFHKEMEAITSNGASVLAGISRSASCK